jgi:STE24 endopeptidase
MSTAHLWSLRAGKRRAGRRPIAGRPGNASWAPALAGALAVARAAVLVLRPDDGLIDPDPVDVGECFTAEDIARARRFGRPQLALHAAAGLVGVGVLAAFAARPPRLRSLAGRPLLEASAVGAGLSAAVGLAPLPLNALARKRALAVGLATQSWGGWARDVAKGSALGIALNAGAASAAVALMRRFPRGWWLPAAGVGVAGTGALTFLAPVALDPLFNRFTPLAAGALREDVLDLAARAGVTVGEVYEVDASRRTTAANAYVTGLGATKRVVLFDTLLREFTREETRLVVAHELAHVRHRDVARGLGHLALSAPAGMYAAAMLARRLQRAPGGPAAAGARLTTHAGMAVESAPNGRTDAATAAALPALALSLGVVSAAVGSLACALSRRVEARADAFSLSLTDAPESFVAFERRIVRQNLADPDPPRWLVRLLATHPPAVRRIGIARAYARGARPR